MRSRPCRKEGWYWRAPASARLRENSMECTMPVLTDVWIRLGRSVFQLDHIYYKIGTGNENIRADTAGNEENGANVSILLFPFVRSKWADSYSERDRPCRAVSADMPTIFPRWLILPDAVSDSFVLQFLIIILGLFLAFFGINIGFDSSATPLTPPPFANVE